MSSMKIAQTITKINWFLTANYGHEIYEIRRTHSVRGLSGSMLEIVLGSETENNLFYKIKDQVADIVISSLGWADREKKGNNYFLFVGKKPKDFAYTREGPVIVVYFPKERREKW